MPKKCRGPRMPKEQQEKRPATPTFLLELPLVVDAGQPSRLRAHLEAARQLYNAILSEGQKRLRRMRADPAWHVACTIPRTQKAERGAAFSALRKTSGFTEAALHEAVKHLRVGWIAEHIEAVLAQTLASRAYRALNRVCLGKGKRVRFRSRGRGFSSVENKRNDTSLRFVLQPPEEGNAGYLLWNGDQLPALIDWKDEVVTHGLSHRIKYARLIQRPTSSPKAAGADAQGDRYFVQLALEGKPHRKKKHTVGTSIVGGDLGPSTLALFPQEGEASLEVFCAELAPDAKAIRR
ncbi:MAG TPA: transposase, partial [Ktedonobacteraceae bacterium]|nr:transposase [Ktedonobacteraceae bacterium]